MAKSTSSVPAGYATVTPVIVCQDARQQLAWYERALGAEVQDIHPGPDGKVLHAAMRVGNSQVMLNDEMMGAKSAQTLGGSPVELWLYVEDCDAVFDRAVKAGAKAQMKPEDMFWGDRMGNFSDPFGLTWSVATHKEDVTPEEMRVRQEQFFAQMAGKS
jgi:PhnB protein